MQGLIALYQSQGYVNGMIRAGEVEARLLPGNRCGRIARVSPAKHFFLQNDYDTNPLFKASGTCISMIKRMVVLAKYFPSSHMPPNIYGIRNTYLKRHGV